MIRENIQPIIALMENKCKLWDKFKLSCFGGITVARNDSDAKIIICYANFSNQHP